jgi:hypothetical protein
MIPQRNFFSPYRAVEVDTDTTEGDGTESQPSSSKNQNQKGVESSCPIIISISVNLLNFQGELNIFMKGSFEFRTSRNGIKVLPRKWLIIQP